MPIAQPCADAEVAGEPEEQSKGESEAARPRIHFSADSSCVCFNIYGDSDSEHRAEPEDLLLTAHAECSNSDGSGKHGNSVSLLPPSCTQILASADHFPPDNPTPAQSGSGKSTQTLPGSPRAQRDNSATYMSALELTTREARRFGQAWQVFYSWARSHSRAHQTHQEEMEANVL